MQVLFVAGFGPIVRDREASRRLYGDDLGISLAAEADGYLHTEGLAGVKTFALWPLAQAAESCFGTPQWPEQFPAPHAWLEFDVDDLEAATAELRAQGYALLVAARVEPSLGHRRRPRPRSRRDHTRRLLSWPFRSSVAPAWHWPAEGARASGRMS
jgi:hypothetical protein